MKFSNYTEIRILAILGIITLAWHLLTVFGAFLGMFADIFVLLIISWIISFVLDPVVVKLTSPRFPRIAASLVTYLAIMALSVILFMVVIPTSVTQITQLAALLPGYLPENFLLTNRVADFLASTAANSVILASMVASTATNLLLAFILSFYFLVSKAEITKFFLDIVPNQYEEDFAFLEKTLNRVFGSFLQVQVVLGLFLGIITFVCLLILGIDYALSTSILSGLLAMVPVAGAILFLFPIILAGLTAGIEKTIIAIVVILLSAQLVFNVLSPKLLGSALKIHPIVVLLSFLVGYRVAGIWGAIFSVPVISVITVIGKELLVYWKQEADK